MLWGHGLEVDTSALMSQASQLRDTAAQLSSTIHSLEQVDVGPWRGEAARLERLEHRRKLNRLRNLKETIPPVANALDEAGQAFTATQNTQRRANVFAASQGFGFAFSGIVTGSGSGSVLRRVTVRARLTCISINATARLNFIDARLAAKLGHQLAKFGAKSLLDKAASLAQFGLEWTDDTALSGLEWLKGRWDATWPAIKRFFTDAVVPRWFTDLVTKGEVPQLAEVLAAGLYKGGQFVGIVANAITGEDLHLFDDGTARVGEAQLLASRSYDGITSIVREMMEVYPQTGDPSIRVTAITGADGQVRFAVAIPGTVEGLDSLRYMSQMNSQFDGFLYGQAHVYEVKIGRDTE